MPIGRWVIHVEKICSTSRERQILAQRQSHFALHHMRRYLRQQPERGTSLVGWHVSPCISPYYGRSALCTSSAPRLNTLFSSLHNVVLHHSKVTQGKARVCRCIAVLVILHMILPQTLDKDKAAWYCLRFVQQWGAAMLEQSLRLRSKAALSLFYPNTHPRLWRAHCFRSLCSLVSLFKAD